MQEIKLNIQGKEDIVMLQQGLNWIRQHILTDHVKLFELREKYGEKGHKIVDDTINDSIVTYDHIISMIAQLDKILEGEDGKSKDS